MITDLAGTMQTLDAAATEVDKDLKAVLEQRDLCRDIKAEDWAEVKG